MTDTINTGGAPESVDGQTAFDREVEFLEWVYETLGEINPSNYGHDDVCELNDKSVEVILAIKVRLEAMNHSPASRAALAQGGGDE